MATQLFVNVAATSLSSALVRSPTNLSPVSFPQLVVGDGRDYEIFFVDGAGGYASFSGDASYIPYIAIGNCGYPTGGTFTLTLGANTTAALAYNISAAALQTALEGLASIGSGNVSVIGTAGVYYTVTFIGALANTNVSEITADFSGLTPAATVEVSTIVIGGGGKNEVQLLTMAANPITFADDWAPITNGWTGQLSTRTLEIIQAFAAAGGELTEVFQVTVADPLGVRTTYVKQAAIIVCTIINPESFAGADKPLLATQAALNAAVLGNNNFTYEAQSSTGAGNTNITRPSTSRHHSAIATVTGTAGTRTFSILTTNSPIAGDTVMLTVLPDDIVGNVIEIRNATNVGTLLASVTTTDSEQPFFFLLTWDGSIWTVELDSSALLAKVGNLAGIADPTTARANLQSLFSTIESKTANFTVDDTMDGTFFAVSAAAGTVLVTIPDASSVPPGFCICIQKTDALAFPVTTAPATVTLSQQLASIVILSDGTNWQIPLQYAPTTSAGGSLNFVQNRYTLTGFTGGTSTDLDGISTAGGATPIYTAILIVIGVPPLPSMWQLRTGTDASSADVVRPTDYDETTNPVCWYKLL